MWLKRAFFGLTADVPLVLSSRPTGLGQPEGGVVLRPVGADGAGPEEVADHPRARGGGGGGGVAGSVRAEGQPLPGVPVWRPAPD